MDCQTCGTKLTEFNATSYRHIHDIGNCAQVLLAQRDRARVALKEVGRLVQVEFDDDANDFGDVGGTMEEIRDIVREELLNGPPAE
jgi:hypothetical protein